MISLGTRYIDYGLTGGLFMLLAIVLYACLPSEVPLPSLLSLYETQRLAMPVSPADAVITTALTSLFVICVFATGLMLDLIGSVLVVWEAAVFRQHIARNNNWILPVFDKYHLFLGDDLQEFMDVKRHPLKDILSPKAILRGLSPKELAKPLAVIPRFSRLQSVLLSHLLLLTDASKIEIVLDQLHTCRVARAVSSGLYLLAILFFALWGYGLLINVTQIIEAGTAAWYVENWPVFTFFIFSILLSGFVVRRAYSRFCASLFAFVFVLDNQDTKIPATA